MADRTPDGAVLTIGGGDLSGTIDPLGAELVALHDGEGRALLTAGASAGWSGHAPILFPVVGASRRDAIRVDGSDWPMPRHGFARRSLFRVDDFQTDGAALTLLDTPATRACWPFAFALTLAYRIVGASLTATATITNRGARPMPTSFGWHPGFAWPLPFGQPRDDHRIDFAAHEPAVLRRIGAGGLIAADPRPSPLIGRRLALNDDLFTDDALIWDPVASDRVVYGAASGPRLEVAFPDTPRLGIWSKPGAGFVCIEPWHGIAEDAGPSRDAPPAEFAARPGVFEVAVGAEWQTSMTVTLRA